LHVSNLILLNIHVPESNLLREIGSSDNLKVELYRFLQKLSEKRSETRGTYLRALRQFVQWYESDGCCEFEVTDLQRYKEYLSVRRKLSPVSVSTYLTAVRRFCQYLVEEGFLRRNPAHEVGGNKRPGSHSRATLPRADVQKLLDCIERTDERGKRDYAVVRLMLDCALSEIEIVRADVGDFTVDDTGARLVVQGKGRNEKDQVVSLTADAAGAIREYLSVYNSVEASLPLFRSAGNRTRGLRMTTRGVRDRVNGYLERSGIKQGRKRFITPYSLRHTAAALMADSGASLDEIRQRMRLGTNATAMLYMSPKAKTPILESS
jgi:integrase/recombinase XerC